MNCQVAKNTISLGQIGNSLLEQIPRRGYWNFGSTDDHRPLPNWQHSEDDFKQSRFSSAIMTNNGYYFTQSYLDLKAIQNLLSSVARDEIFQS